MEKQSDVNDFLKIENDSQTQKYIEGFLQKNKIFDLNKNDQITKTAILVSQFPWGKGRTIEELLITKKFGTCTAKHLTLQACYNFLGINCKQVMSTFKWGEQGIRFPNNLQKILSEGEWDHGHNFLQVEKNDDTKIDIDITWNKELKDFGFKTFPEKWNGQNSFIGAKINQRWEDIDMKKKKIELIESLSPELRERRELFLKNLIQWIHSINKLKLNLSKPYA